MVSITFATTKKLAVFLLALQVAAGPIGSDQASAPKKQPQYANSVYNKPVKPCDVLLKEAHSTSKTGVQKRLSPDDAGRAYFQGAENRCYLESKVEQDAPQSEWTMQTSRDSLAGNGWYAEVAKKSGIDSALSDLQSREMMSQA